MERGRVYYLYIIVILFFFLPLLGCGGNSTDSAENGGGQAFVEINSIQVPIFSSAGEQLNYTRSWFSESNTKRAALEAFIQLYPEEEKFCGIASLDLAYLQLGPDYRFSQKYEAFAAIKEFKKITSVYSDYNAIMAKAYWYIGWIYSDIIKDNQKAENYFRKVAADYPEEQIFLLPPAPWVSIIYQPDHDITSQNKTPSNYWAALALLEIVKLNEGEKAWRPFLQLWEKYRETASAGIGLLVILKKRVHMDKTIAYAMEYMENDFNNVHLLSDIRQEVQRITIRNKEF